MCVAQLPRGTGTELQALHIVCQREVGSRCRPFPADNAYGEDGEVVQLHILAVKDKLLDARNHVGKDTLDDTGRVGGVMVCHVLCQTFGVIRLFDDGTRIPEAFQWAVLARHLILFVTNHKQLKFKS